jgi:hypothetical protein
VLSAISVHTDYLALQQAKTQRWPFFRFTMEARNGKDYFQLSLSYYNKSGLRKSSTFFQKCVSVYMLYPLMIIFYLMVIYNIRYKHSDIFDIAEVFQSVSVFGNVRLITVCYLYIHFIFQLVFRKTLLIIHGSLLEEIIEDHSHFWSYDLFGKVSGNRLRKTMDLCVSIIKLFIIGGVITASIYWTAPFYIKNYSLPHACWIPGNNFVATIILYILESIFYIEVVVIIVAFDGFYLLMCFNLKIQFILLCKAVKSIQLGVNATKADEEVCWMKLKQYNHYHKFLLK